MQRLIILLCILAITSSCNKDEVILSQSAPKIVLDNPSGIYTVKVGREVTIAPRYDNAEDAAFEWSIEGKVVCTDASYTYVAETAGEEFVTITVTTEAGSDSEEVRIDIVELEIPTVSVAVGEEGFTILQNSTLQLTASVRECSIPTALSWQVDGSEVSTTNTCTFEGSTLGTHLIRFTAENEDGSDSVEFAIHVCTAEEMPFEWHFDNREFNVASGREVLIAPCFISVNEGVAFEWKIDGTTEAEADTSSFIFSRTEVGSYDVTCTARLGEQMAEQHFTVTVCPAEGTYKREKSATSQASFSQLFEYRPAPGQFINDTQTGGFTGAETTPEAAAAYAKSRMESSLFVSLGGFGGYIVVGFDHSIDNTGGYDFSIEGNALETWSEPGIVWVMQDENGDGLPNDTWYELSGCDAENPATVKNYSVTYYRPAAKGMPVPWRDNTGRSGAIEYIASQHGQDYYYPAWLAEESYTLCGTMLENRSYDKFGNGAFWVLPPFDWGYADNFSPTDRLDASGNFSAESLRNHFRISDAVDWAGRAVDLKYIDFIKVQTAQNAACGWAGESSTEVQGFYDCSLLR